jgi:hypothetical protein
LARDVGIEFFKQLRWKRLIGGHGGENYGSGQMTQGTVAGYLEALNLSCRVRWRSARSFSARWRANATSGAVASRERKDITRSCAARTRAMKDFSR